MRPIHSSARPRGTLPKGTTALSVAAVSTMTWRRSSSAQGRTQFSPSLVCHAPARSLLCVHFSAFSCLSPPYPATWLPPEFAACCKLHRCAAGWIFMSVSVRDDLCLLTFTRGMYHRAPASVLGTELSVDLGLVLPLDGRIIRRCIPWRYLHADDCRRLHFRGAVWTLCKVLFLHAGPGAEKTLYMEPFGCKNDQSTKAGSGQA